VALVVQIPVTRYGSLNFPLHRARVSHRES